MMHLAWLNASYCWVINENGIFSEVQRGVECYEIGGKVGKNTDPKTHKDNNLAKLNDAKRAVFARSLHKRHLKNKENTGVLWV